MPLQFVFWDTQHGSATYINTPNQLNFVQDLGTGSYSESEEEFSPLKHLKSRYNVDKLDWVIITHPHKDHIADIEKFSQFSPSALLRPKHLSKDNIMEDVREKDEDIFEEYFRIDNRYTSEISSQDDPALPDNNGDVEVKTFCSRSCGESNINNHSYVTLWSYAGSKVMLPGDNESPSWNKLLEIEEFQDAIKDVDILLAPHHGRERGFHSELFDYFEPKLTIVSDGRFGDTSATSRYSDVSKGWKVHRRNGKSEERYCVTTRNDGVISLKLGYTDSQKPYIQVKID